MNSVTYFGQDNAPYCKDVARSLELFANFKPEPDFKTKWGIDREGITYKNCTK